MLKFSSEEEALQHLSNITGKKIKIAAVDNLDKLGITEEKREWYISGDGPNTVRCSHSLIVSDDANEKELIKYLEEEMHDIALLFQKRFGKHNLYIYPPEEINTYFGGVKGIEYGIEFKKPSRIFDWDYSNDADKNLEIFKKTLKRYGFEKDSNSADDYVPHDGIS